MTGGSGGDAGAASADPATAAWFAPPPGRGGPQVIPRPSAAKPGGPPPWASLASEARRPTVDAIRAALSAVGAPEPSIVEARGQRAGSAVLAPLYEHDGEAWIVLTRRTMELRSHSGQVSFPGGRREPGETLLEAALREADEEIGLDPATVEVIGELDHLATISSGSAIVPYVGVLPGRPERLHRNASEVERILHVPLAELCDPAVFRCEIWPIPREHPIFFFELAGDTLWGATAAMVRQLLGLATGTLGRGDLAHF